MAEEEIFRCCSYGRKFNVAAALKVIGDMLQLFLCQQDVCSSCPHVSRYM